MSNERTSGNWKSNISHSLGELLNLIEELRSDFEYMYLVFLLVNVTFMKQVTPSMLDSPKENQIIILSRCVI